MRKAGPLLVGFILTCLVSALPAEESALDEALRLIEEDGPSDWKKEFPLPTPQEFVPKHIEALLRRVEADGGPQPGKQVAQVVTLDWIHKYQGAKRSTLYYLLFLPEGYEEQAEPWPLMVFLHDGGQRGWDLSKIKTCGPPQMVETRKDFPFIVLSPLCPMGQMFNLMPVMELIDHVAGQFRVDQRRIVVMGGSLGGIGSWALAATHPDRIAAAIPIDHPGNLKMATDLAHTPLWVFYGAKDEAFWAGKKTVAAIKAAGNTQVRFTVYPELGHGSWVEAYKDEALYLWLLQQRLSR